MSNSENLLIPPSGDFVLFSAQVDEDFSSDPSWEWGPASFRQMSTVDENALGHFQDADPSESRVRVSPEERAKSFTSSAAETLFPPPSSPSVKASGPIKRWHRENESPITLIDGVPPIVGFECLALTDSYGDSNKHRAILIAHLLGREGESGRNVPFDASKAMALTERLYSHVRSPRGLQDTLARLSAVVGKGLSFAAGPGDREDTVLCYPVFTALDLRADCDTDVLAARELSTITPSKKHGSTKVDDRVDRARRDLRRLSDTWCVSVTSRGAVFMSSHAERFNMAPLYVSSIYADAIAATFLVRGALVDIDIWAHDVQDSLPLGEGDIAQSLAKDLERLLMIRRQYFFVTERLSRLHLSEGRNLKVILTAVRENLDLDGLESHVAARFQVLVETVNLRRELAASESEREVAVRQNWTNLILSTLALISLPLTLLYGIIDLWNAAPGYRGWLVGGTILIVVVGGAVTLWMFKKRRRLIRSTH